MPVVIIRRADYNYKILKPLFYEIMDSLAGDRIQQDMRVVIKPNLLAPASPDKAIVTHPMIVKAAVEYVIDKGARPQISDSPAVGSFEKILRESGIKDALAGLDAGYKEFKDSLSVNVGKPFENIDIAADAIEADYFINLPKLKTHTQMLMTLGIKNLFGCIVGLRKPEWHFRTGVNREMFARLLVKIYKAVRPSVTIIDGILSMEGQGPGKGGEPRHLGVLLGSGNAAALDDAVCRMLGIPEETVLTNRYAREQGLLGDDVTMDGTLPHIHDFRLPEITPLVFGPRTMHGFMRRHLTQRPTCESDLCRLCGECWKYCPAKAIGHDNRNIHFDYDRCIRCYCCIEVCPYGAMKAVETLPGKVARKILRR
jgi:uncharacterized protein (DUF362 family)/Pyruvate/2-oxoacid:ferredoxin oxidoreductase delta subunit